MQEGGNAGAVEFFFDPMCPWAFEASRWMRSVREQTGIEITWRFFSLETVNRGEGKLFPWERPWSYGWSMMRVGAYLRRRSPLLLDRWYLENGEAFFHRGEPVFDTEGAKRVVSRLGLPPALVDEAIADETTHDDVRSDHEHLVRTHGGHGVPTLVFPDGNAVFGPVVMPAPDGSAAIRLWESILVWREFPHLYEIRRPKTELDLRYIDNALRTYFEARPWKTVENRAP